MEIVVSLALLSIVMVMITTVFLTALRIISTHAKLKEYNAYAAGAVENNMAGEAADAEASVSQTSGNFTVNFTYNSIDVTGDYIEGTDTDENTSYYYFAPNP